ncbi:RAMP superfamily CRISPR-associated protein [Anabaena catenula]|uniref:Type III-B CRISPR module RAMP protein Cmr4 n=1 Tax=Anabaena catenula FACHB-362 TaxID=2692877 RepID=A0ABR8J1W8_9NOST|nr:RAMP superfamily CRISPR-associated protein [Anabaena catenula]MBD2692125.1 type III-B CRISPR module RAMP protein Cmr4 [Anabaena catenula FACHB-362]
MYQKAYGIIETLAPVHVGATAGEENGNLNLIFRDQFTQTGLIIGSSIRGRLRADMRQYRKNLELEKTTEVSSAINEEIWYGKESKHGEQDSTSEALIKLEHASIVWLPVFCPGQPIVWVSCPSLLKRYHRVAQLSKEIKPPEPYTASKELWGKALISQDEEYKDKKFLFFNLGFLELETQKDLSAWFPLDENGEQKKLPAVVVDDNDMAMIHDMALYRQSRVALDDKEKKAKQGQFFNTEALPEGTILAFPIAIKPDEKNPPKTWKPIEGKMEGEMYLGGLESIGFGHCYVKVEIIESKKQS